MLKMKIMKKKLIKEIRYEGQNNLSPQKLTVIYKKFET